MLTTMLTLTAVVVMATNVTVPPTDGWDSPTSVIQPGEYAPPMYEEPEPPHEHPSVEAPAQSYRATWDLIAQCESGGSWTLNTGNGYYGGLQFSLRSWQWVGGSGYPHQASKAEQIARAEKLLSLQGWGAWPACSRKLGLR